MVEDIEAQTSMFDYALPRYFSRSRLQKCGTTKNATELISVYALTKLTFKSTKIPKTVFFIKEQFELATLRLPSKVCFFKVSFLSALKLRFKR